MDKLSKENATLSVQTLCPSAVTSDAEKTAFESRYLEMYKELQKVKMDNYKLWTEKKAEFDRLTAKVLLQ